MIGTGPFKLDSFDPTTGNVSVSKNPSYWRKGFPYLDGIDFIVQEESSQRWSGLEGGQFDISDGLGRPGPREGCRPSRQPRRSSSRRAARRSATC